ncbi:hypothetical protein E1B28_002366 [Marasmius oreades]|uniref:Uncharacterized protein n=1 Tax=Marasmius oreades TaxID=181124 RepID=A0A9P7RMH4_9AGAR|nr:uncharacterized protein E1B28_002366 [Marasmius oreades]KAG7086411.1 hypothetical protein E1B28_002366 [Marasmius oreades]
MSRVRLRNVHGPISSITFESQLELSSAFLTLFEVVEWSWVIDPSLARGRCRLSVALVLAIPSLETIPISPFKCLVALLPTPGQCAQLSYFCTRILSKKTIQAQVQ